jgi:hypothetical protein
MTQRTGGTGRVRPVPPVPRHRQRPSTVASRCHAASRCRSARARDARRACSDRVGSGRAGRRVRRLQRTSASPMRSATRSARETERRTGGEEVVSTGRVDVVVAMMSPSGIRRRTGIAGTPRSAGKRRGNSTENAARIGSAHSARNAQNRRHGDARGDHGTPDTAHRRIRVGSGSGPAGSRRRHALEDERARHGAPAAGARRRTPDSGVGRSRVSARRRREGRGGRVPRCGTGWRRSV